MSLTFKINPMVDSFYARFDELRRTIKKIVMEHGSLTITLCLFKKHLTEK